MKQSVILVLVAIFLGCAGAPFESIDFTKEKPLDSDLVGTYVPTAKTLEFIKSKAEYPKAVTSIVLSKDGTFRFNNIPDCWNAFVEPKGKYDSGNGKWYVREGQGSWMVILYFPSTEGFNSSKREGSLTLSKIDLVGQRPPHLLHLTVGDPDHEEAMQFEMVGAPQ